MKKKINILILGLLLSTAAQAQIFMTEDDHNLRSRSSEVLGVVPLNGVNYDQTNETYTPIGEGVLLLAALGGAYLLKKKKNNE